MLSFKHKVIPVLLVEVTKTPATKDTIVLFYRPIKLLNADGVELYPRIIVLYLSRRLLKHFNVEEVPLMKTEFASVTTHDLEDSILPSSLITVQIFENSVCSFFHLHL